MHANHILPTKILPTEVEWGLIIDWPYSLRCSQKTTHGSPVRALNGCLLWVSYMVSVPPRFSVSCYFDRVIKVPDARSIDCYDKSRVTGDLQTMTMIDIMIMIMTKRLEDYNVFAITILCKTSVRNDISIIEAYSVSNFGIANKMLQYRYRNYADLRGRPDIETPIANQSH